MGLWERVPAAWRSELAALESHIDAIGDRLEVQGRESRVLPAVDKVFRALDVGPDAVRVLIVGQDPYPGAAHACGLSFSVPPGTSPLPPSLRNILAEVAGDIGPSMAADGDLQPWADQGVMLLNRNLTVVEGDPLSHATIGWHAVSDAIVAAVVRRSPDAVAILWGAQAQQLAGCFPPGSVVASAHPSPLSAHRGFLGSRPFSRANAILLERHMPPIRW